MDNTDKMVVAILAATKAAAEKKDTSGQYVAEYERMLRVYERRAKPIASKDDKGEHTPASAHLA